MPDSGLFVGVDEFTLVLRPAMPIDVFHWSETAGRIIDSFIVKSRLNDLFGALEIAEKGLQQGYTSGIKCANVPWHLAICWHESHPDMGVCIKFSAWAWAAYQENFEHMDIRVFLRMVQDELYTTRLSRIDFTADYKNYLDVSPDSLYRQINNGKIAIVNDKGRDGIKKIKGYSENGIYQTVYAGSRSGKSPAFLRVYDKRLEQLRTMGFRYDEALACESWMRLEAVFCHEYAHQITARLLKDAQTPLDRIIASTILSKYRFVNTQTGALLDITSDLIDIVNGAYPVHLCSARSKDNDLEKSIKAIVENSGLFSTLFKCYEIWGDTAEIQLLKYLLSCFHTTYRDPILEDMKNKPSTQASRTREMQRWLNEHKSSMLKYPTLNDYLSTLENKP